MCGHQQFLNEIDEQTKQTLKEKQSPQQQYAEAIEPHLEIHDIKFSWKEGDAPPCAMERGSTAVSAGGIVYFSTHTGEIYSYNTGYKTWCLLRLCNRKDFAIVILHGRLTVIGGTEDEMITNSLLSLKGTGTTDRSTWTKQLPPMIKGRANPTAISIENHLIVVGGSTDDKEEPYSDSVEVYDTNLNKWSRASSLPKIGALGGASAALCYNNIYVLGARYHASRSNAVLTCSLQDIIQSCKAPSHKCVWAFAADTPVECTTCVSVNNQLLLFGGAGLL